MQTVPLEGPPRCPHSIMLFGSETEGKKSNYCLSCTPGGPRRTRNVVLPRSSGTQLQARSIRANKMVDGRCPECGSICHIVLENGMWECAEDGVRYPAPRKQPRS